MKNHCKDKPDRNNKGYTTKIICSIIQAFSYTASYKIQQMGKTTLFMVFFPFAGGGYFYLKRLN